jgi:IclR family transcriptional regulator, acetate operon repressor
MASRPGTQAVDRAAGLLAVVVRAEGPVTITDLYKASGLPRSTTSRLLLALERNQLIRRVKDGAYVPGELFGMAGRGHTAPSGDDPR